MKRSGRERQTSKKNWPVSYVENYVSRQDNTLPVTGHGRGANMNPFLPQWATPLGVPLLAWLRFCQDCADLRLFLPGPLSPSFPSVRWVIWSESFPFQLLLTLPQSIHRCLPQYISGVSVLIKHLLSRWGQFWGLHSTHFSLPRELCPSPLLCLWTNGMPSIGCCPFPISLPSYRSTSLPPSSTLLAFETLSLRKSILS